MDDLLNFTPFGTPTTVNVLADDYADAGLDPTSLLLADGDERVPTLPVPGKGSWSARNGVIGFDPAPGFVGAVTATYEVRDRLGTPATARVRVTVDPPAAPVAVPDPVSSSVRPIVVAPLANDSPGPSGAALVPSSVRLLDGTTPVLSLSVPGEGEYVVNPAAATVTFTPKVTTSTGTIDGGGVVESPGFPGGPATPVRYRVTDANGAVAESTIAITVLPQTTR